MRIKEVLINNGFENYLNKIAPAILNAEVGDCVNAREIPLTIEKLFDGFELFPNDESELISINLEDNEFTPIAFIGVSAEGYWVSEVGCDENMNVSYEYYDL